MGNQVSLEGTNADPLKFDMRKQQFGASILGAKSNVGLNIMLNGERGKSGFALFNNNTAETDTDYKSNNKQDKEYIDKQDKSDIKIPTLFEWKEGGNTVYLTGSFCNWNQKFLMNQVNNKFEFILVN